MQSITLTWINNGKTVTEDCWLVDDEDSIFAMGSDRPLTVMTENGVGNTVGTIAGGLVMFEDDEGLFGVPPNDVVEIKIKE